MVILPKRSILSRLPAIALSEKAISPLFTPEAFRQTLLASIQNAKRRIYIAALYLENDEAGQEVLEALYQAKQHNPTLKIVVLLDWHRAQRGRIGEQTQLNNVVWYQQYAQQHPQDILIYGVPVQTRELFGVFHLKGFIIDDQILYSGASLNNVYLHKQDKYRLDRYHLISSMQLADCMVNYLVGVIVNHPAVHCLNQPNIPSTRQLRKEIREFRETLAKEQYKTKAITNKGIELTINPIAGLGKGNALSKLIVDIVSQTQSQVFICTPYFNFPRPLTLALTRAIKRGVKIDIVIGDKTANDFYISPNEPFHVIGALPYLYEMNLRRFLKRHNQALESGQVSVHLWKDQDNTYHAKGVWSDQRYILLTGSNLNPRAFRLDMENGLLIHDPQAELQKQSHAEQLALLQHTRAITHYKELESVRDYPEQVKKLLTRLSRVRIDRMVNLIL